MGSRVLTSRNLTLEVRWLSFNAIARTHPSGESAIACAFPSLSSKPTGSTSEMGQILNSPEGASRYDGLPAGEEHRIVSNRHWDRVQLHTIREPPDIDVVAGRSRYMLTVGREDHSPATPSGSIELPNQPSTLGR